MGTEWGVTFAEAGIFQPLRLEMGESQAHGVRDTGSVIRERCKLDSRMAAFTVSSRTSGGIVGGHSAPTPTDTPRADCYILAFLFQTGP